MNTSEECSLDVANFNEEEFRALILAAPDKDYASLTRFLLRELNKAEEAGLMDKAGIYRLLMRVCSLVLNPSNRACPFDRMIPYWQGNRASYGVQDFSESDIHFLEEIWDKVQLPTLKARLADVIWSSDCETRKAKRYTYAKYAAEEYRKIPLTPEDWRFDGKACFLRCLTLLRQVQGKKKSKDVICTLEGRVLQEFLNASISPFFYLKDLIEVLDELSDRRSFAPEVAAKLEQLGVELKQSKDWHQSQCLYEYAEKWYGIARNMDKEQEMRREVAEAIVREAELNNCIFAAEGIQKALSIYLKLTITPQNAETINTRIRELRDKMQSLRQMLPSQMIPIETKIDASKTVQHVREVISNKSPLDALRILANFAAPPRVSDLVENWQSGIFKSPFSLLFGGSHYDENFRKIHISPGQSLTEEFGINNPKVQESMLFQYSQWAQFTALAGVVPALEVLYVEHRFTEDDFLEFTRLSPIVPVDRHVISAKGLFAGYKNDFCTAMHILAPQVENMVREAIREYVETRFTDENGVEDEKALASLLEKPEATEVMGEDLVYSLKAIFCLKSGANIRNKIAHGLIDYEESQSASYIYAWWFVFRLVFNTFADFTGCFDTRHNQLSSQGENQ